MWCVDNVPNSGQCDEAEVCWCYGIPILPGCKGQGSNKYEGEDEDEVDGDGDHDQVGGHVALLANLVESESLGPPVHPRGQLRVPPPGPAPPAQDPAVQPPEGDSHPVSNLIVKHISV